MRVFLSLLLLAVFQQAVAQAPSSPSDRFYWASGLDGALFQSARIKRTGVDEELGVLRFSAVLNLGYHFHADAGRHVGFFTGVDVKNIGFIEKEGDLTTKRRVYNVGVPLGIKFGNMPGRRYGYIGGGIDVPFNYREKRFEDRGNKEKMSEWFSDRTPRFMPYVFAGYTFLPAAITLKAQYYPGNFFDEDFRYDDPPTPGTITQPYAGTTVNLFYLSLSFDIKTGQKQRARMEEGNPVTAR